MKPTQVSDREVRGDPGPTIIQSNPKIRSTSSAQSRRKMLKGKLNSGESYGDGEQNGPEPLPALKGTPPSFYSQSAQPILWENDSPYPSSLTTANRNILDVREKDDRHSAKSSKRITAFN